ncbi:MAG: hypothetical protein NVS4B3_26100 [Gemmatimonadaceae bacterium]
MATAPSRLPTVNGIVEFPRVVQNGRADCGIACLAAIARYYDIEIRITRLRRLASSDRRGTSVLGLVTAARRLGLETKGVQGSVSSLARIPLPAIAHMMVEGGGHFVVLFAIADCAVGIMDPARGSSAWVARSAFASRWSGTLVLIAPPPGWVRSRRKTPQTDMPRRLFPGVRSARMLLLRHGVARPCLGSVARHWFHVLAQGRRR